MISITQFYSSAKKTFKVCLLFSVFIFSANQLNAQEYISSESAIANLQTELEHSDLILDTQTKENNPEYQKAYTIKEMIRRINLKIKSGSTVEQAYIAAVPKVTFDKMHKFYYLAPNENGKLSYEWVSEVILPLITK